MVLIWGVIDEPILFDDCVRMIKEVQEKCIPQKREVDHKERESGLMLELLLDSKNYIYCFL